MKNYNYVYKITNHQPQDEREFYIGVRSSKVKPEDDLKYWSSSKYLNNAIREYGVEYFSKEILSVWSTREEANIEEIRLHDEFNVAQNPKFYNKSKSTSKRFCTQGYVTVYDVNLNKYKNIMKIEFDTNTDIYTATTKNQVTVLDLRDNNIKNVSKNDFDQFEYYQSIAKNTFPVIDNRDNLIKRVTCDEFTNTEHYTSIMKNTIIVKDLRDGKNKRVSCFDYKDKPYYEFVLKNSLTVLDIKTNKYRRVTTEEYENNSDLITLNSQTILIYDSNHNLVYTVRNSFTKFCKLHGLPGRSFEMSYQRNGKKLYSQVTNQNNPKFKFKNWYAIKEPKPFN